MQSAAQPRQGKDLEPHVRGAGFLLAREQDLEARRKARKFQAIPCTSRPKWAHIRELLPHRSGVTTRTGVAPGDHRAGGLDGSKSGVRGGDRGDIRELLPHRSGVLRDPSGQGARSACALLSIQISR